MEDHRVQLEGACHCREVRFTVTLADGWASVRRCNCSYCTMRGAVAVSARLADLHFIAGEDRLSLYQFNSFAAKHYFCSRCGIYTHHQRRSRPEEFGVNVACLAGVSPFDFARIPVMEGRLHPKDSQGGAQIAGFLNYEPVAPSERG